MILSKDQILEADDLKSVPVEVPEWNGTVLVRTMTGADRNAFEQSLVTIGPDGMRKPNLVNMEAKLVAMTVVTETGALMFEPADVERIALKSSAAIRRLFDAASKLNGIGQDAEVDAAKNSEAGPSESSTSA